MIRTPNLQVIQPGQTRRRHQRTPNFPVAGTMKPYGLYPIMAHPVLPGETLQNFKLKWRVLSKPINNPLVGSWCEGWLFYVKFTDLDTDLGEMFISDGFSPTAYQAASADDRYFTKDGQIDWIRMCVDRIADIYFTHETEQPRSIDGVPLTKLQNVSWTQNMIFKDETTPVPIQDQGDNFANLTGFQLMQQMAQSELTYEKYLQQFGVQSVKPNLGHPEILRFARSWTLPTNQVDPTSGTPSSAWIWSDEIVADKAKRFDEPGFLIYLAAVRPKMYQKHLRYSMIGNLWGFSDWFPAYNLPDPTAGIKEMEQTDDVFHEDAYGASSGDLLWYDHRDLLSHGEQFINEWDANPYALPMSSGLSVAAGANTEDVRGEYCTSADIAGLFKSETASDQVLFYEGMAQMRIQGHVTDTTR